MNTHRYSLFAAAALLVAAVAGAQEVQRSNARWQAWYGCWGAVPRDSAGAMTQPRTVCMKPTANPDVVEVVAVADGKVMHRDTVDASGVLHSVAADGCKGSESARWSADGRRVFLTSLTTCDGAVTKTTSLLAMTPFNEWLDIRSVSSSGTTVVNVARYHEIGFGRNTPDEIVEAVRGYAPNIDAARLATGAPIPASAVIEAAKVVDNTVMQAWVTQTGLDFVTDAKSLEQLADAGISSDITDAMVAVDANSRDVYDLRFAAPWDRQASSYWDQGTGMRVWYTETDPWGYGLGQWRYGRTYQRYAFGTNSWSWLRAAGLMGNYQDPWLGVSSTASSSGVSSLLPPTIVLHQDPSNAAPRGRSDKTDSTGDPDSEKKGSDNVLGQIMKKVTGSGSSTSKGSSAKPSPR